jgi:hypothetical protein
MLLAAGIAGFLINDAAVYGWHRWVSHAGVLRWIGNDIFRRRHFHHHFVTYSPERLHGWTYVESCDVTFGVVEILLLIGAVVVTWAGVVPLSTTLAAFCGGVLHGWLAIRVHELCHASEERVRTWPLATKPTLLAVFHRLRDFHDAHHTSRGNYGLLIPPIDVVAGTRAVVAKDRDDASARLFPGFTPERASSCGDSLL